MSPTLPPGARLGRYEIKSQLGAGGMGEVYLAQDTELDRRVALKILPSNLATNQDRMRRFKQEAKSAAALNHPNIAHIYEIGESGIRGGSPTANAGSLHFIAMEFVEGVTLTTKLHHDRTELRKLLRYLQHAAEGLAKAHQAGIVHRDLKPDNIMITSEGHAKILDFGLAKLVEPQPLQGDSAQGHEEIATAIMQQQSTPGVIMGTVGYMSPEQAQGKTNDVDGRSDIFSFGCILFEAATGKKPFAGDSIVKSLHSLIYEPAPPIKELNPDAPAELQRIVRRCLAKDRDERYQSIKDVAIELKELRRELDSGDIDLTVTPVTKSETTFTTDGGSTINSTTAGSILPASNVSSAEYIFSQIGRHKRSVGVALALVLALVIGAAYFVIKYRGSASSVAGISSIAVLPFQNKSDDPDTEYLSDGLSESLIFRLSQLPGLRVSPTSSVMRYKGKESDIATVAKELGVDAVMTGRLVKRGDSLNITVELVDIRNNKTLWGEQYERKMSELLATQREIATNITQKLQLKLSGNENKGVVKRYTNNNEAYQLYLKGRFLFAKRSEHDIRQSIDMFQQAIRLDPNFALAYVGVAEAYNVMPSYPYMSPTEANPLAKQAVAKALEIDPDLPEAHTVAGMIAATYDWDWTKAEQEFKRALELDPNIALTHYRYAWVFLSPMGRHEEAISEMKRAMELEPLSLVQGSNFAAVYIYARQFDKALEQAKRTYDLDPNLVTGQNWLCNSYNQKGMYKESLEISEAVQAKGLALVGLSYAYAKSGRRQDAEAVINRWQETGKTKYIARYWLAVSYAALGDKEAAFTELEKAHQAHDWFFQRLKVDPYMDPLRDDPRFAVLVKSLGL